ncbi:MAG: hypothetical protein A4E20_01430 [Nitrospira sp. SG-bin2]|uniref:hypothetical protein n=1 Tax=Nitrospira cf. moscoviensis SBR1015 TaxID=96242 RepID=UPI000A0EAE6A|nr:hypothetical protein [Nitrospira cf. moscoviensis SBR1015]OQW34866.1 MAG: hypothetical protein A4E20_01430 [Nitrospira sp. SG-bin2]
MSIAAWLKLLYALTTLLYKAVEAYQNYQERERGRLELLLELRRKRDQDKEKANAIAARPVPADDQPILDKL